MKEDKEIQPENVDEKVGQPVDETATEDLTAEQIAGKTPEELAELYGNVKKMRASATEKFQKVADLERQVEALTAEKGYIEDMYEQSKTNQESFTRKFKKHTSNHNQVNKRRLNHLRLLMILKLLIIIC